MKTETKLNFINGSWKESVTGEVEASRNPANTLDIVGYMQKSNRDDLDEAIHAAKIARKEWRELTGAQRGEYLRKTADILEARQEDIAITVTREMGKTIAEAKGEVSRGVAILRYYANEGMQKVGEVIPSTAPDAMLLTTRAPLGTVGIITPWNFPIAIPIWKTAPALVYGNTVILKPAAETSITAAKLMECFDEAGFPAGVINMMTGPGSVIGQGLTEHNDINGITFTGSNGVGKHIAKIAAERNIKFQLEMGGKNPVIVMEDADLDLAIEQIINGAFLSAGQKCTSTSRVIVVSKVYDKLKEGLLDKIKEIKVGNGMNEDTWMGPINNEKQFKTVLSYIKKGMDEGAELLYGGNQLTGEDYENGFFVEPTVFDNVSKTMMIAQEEIFGPVIALMKVDSYDEAISVANDVQFGLSASIFTKDIKKMLTFITDIEAGAIRVNSESAGVELQAPFGGMKASSSHSREQGKAAIEFYTSIKTVLIKG